MKAVITGLALLLLAVPARAQSADSRWQPWLGCWDLTADNVREGAPAAGRRTAGAATRSRNDAVPRVCVTPASGGGVRFETTIQGQPAVEHTIVADATARPLTDTECRGTQRAEWSSDGMRLFTRADLSCANDPAPRRITGISLLTTSGTWLDIQAVTAGAEETVRVRRYYRAAGEPALPRAALAGSVLSLDDVKEASGKVAARALEAALVETEAGFDLKSRTLVDLDAAGVPDSVIDLIVALSYPERFVVERSVRSGGGGGTTFVNDPFMIGWAFGYPAFYDAYYYSPYYYSPFGYRGYGFGAGAFGDGIIVTQAPTSPQPSGTGRVVDGQGYTRIRPRETASNDDGGTSTRTSASSSGGSTSSSGGSTSSSSGGGSSTASSGGGYSSGGSGGGDGGRSAVPR